MAFRLPFDPTELPRESESDTRARHGALRWGRPATEPIVGPGHRLDPALAEFSPDEGRADAADRFDAGYADLPIHLTRFEDGVLFGQGFFACSAGHPTGSRERLYLVSPKRLGELLPELRRRDAERGTLHLVCANGGWRNTYHWLFQCVANVALLGRVAAERGEPYRIVLPPLEPRHRRTLELLGVPFERCLTLGPREYLHDVPLLYSDALHNRFPFQPSPRLIALLDPLRERALAVHPAPTPARFYVSRRDSRARPLVDEGALIEALEARGYRELTLSELPVERQIAAFARAESIVAPHGAGLVHLMFAPPGCRVLEILPDNHRFAFFHRLAQARGLRYSMVLSRSSPAGSPDAGATSVDIDRVLALL